MGNSFDGHDRLHEIVDQNKNPLIKQEQGKPVPVVTVEDAKVVVTVLERLWLYLNGYVQQKGLEMLTGPIAGPISGGKTILWVGIGIVVLALVAFILFKLL